MRSNHLAEEMAAELGMVNLLSIFFWPERGLRRHLWDLVKFVGAMVFLMFFVLMGAGVAMQPLHPDLDPMHTTIDMLGRIDATAIGWMLGAMVLHLGVLVWRSRSSADPQREWAGLALTQGAATLVTLLLLAMGMFLLGPLLAQAGAAMAGERGAHLLLALPVVALRCFFALLVSRMPERELQGIARQPYLD